jgi:hypothetical protein
VLNVVLAATAVGTVAYALREFENIGEARDPELRGEKMRLIGAAVSAAAVLLWPVVWDTLVGYAVVTHHPLTLFGFLWPTVMNLLNLSHIASAQSNRVQNVYNSGTITSNVNTLVGTAFAVGGLLFSQGDPTIAKATSPLIMYALLLLIAFIVPIPNLNPNEYLGFLAAAAQRAFFNYAMGFIICGISINISGRSGQGLAAALRRLCSEAATASASGADGGRDRGATRGA